MVISRNLHVMFGVALKMHKMLFLGNNSSSCFHLHLLRNIIKEVVCLLPL